jgi:hypothetical protein
VTRRISLGCALLGLLVGACQQTWVLDDLSPDSGLTGTGGSGASGGGGKGVGPVDASSDGRCFGSQPPEPIGFTADTPQVLIALDRSSAMNEPLDTMSPSQLNAALNALTALAETYEPSSGGRNNAATIDFAFLDFPENPTDCVAANGCCSGDVTPLATDQTFTYQMFDAAENMCNGNNNGEPPSCIQSKDRPIAAALGQAYDYFSGIGAAPHGNERYVLLVTDGDPSGGCSTTGDDCMDALMAVGKLSDLGVTTEVVAIGNGAPCLTELAGPAGMTPYTATTTDAVYSQLLAVTTVIAQTDCRLTLTEAPSSGELIVEYGQGQAVQTEDGTSTSQTWSYGSDNTRIILHGTLCTNFLKDQNGPFGLQIYDGCAPEHFDQNP